MEKFEKNLNDAIRTLQIADHITYVTFPIVNEKRLIIKIFDEIYKSIINDIKAVLNYETFHRRINIYENGDNLEIFFQIAKDYNITNEQIKKIKEIIEVNQKHKQSAMEFVRRERIIILSDNLKTRILDIYLIKEYLLLAKDILMKISQKINK